jgi:hypothetical protein
MRIIDEWYACNYALGLVCGGYIGDRRRRVKGTVECVDRGGVRVEASCVGKSALDAHFKGMLCLRGYLVLLEE